MPERLHPDLEQQIIDHYNAWEPGSKESLSEMARRFGISRVTLGAVLTRNNVERHRNRRRAPLGSPTLPIGEDPYVTVSLSLFEAMRRIDMLEDQIDHLTRLLQETGLVAVSG